MLKLFRQTVHQYHKNGRPADETNIYPLFPQCCALHQLSLARSPLLLGFNSYWTSVVRLSHLYENQLFRKQFEGALVHIICQSFVYVPVVELPTEHQTWRERRKQVFEQAWSSRKAASRRTRLHRNLATWDNSDIREDTVKHWCLGTCCTGRNMQEKEKFCLLQIIKHYLLLFRNGFPVPLLYRWVHAQRANSFVKVIGLRRFSKFFCSINWTMSMDDWNSFTFTMG